MNCPVGVTILSTNRCLVFEPMVISPFCTTDIFSEILFACNGCFSDRHGIECVTGRKKHFSLIVLLYYSLT